MANRKAVKKVPTPRAKPELASEAAEAPKFTAEFECVGPDGQLRWATRWKNAVQKGGKVDLINQYFARTNGAVGYNTWYLGLHSNNATHSTFSSLSDITASEVGGYSASRMSVSFSTHSTNNFCTASTSFAFTTSTYTVSGAFVGNSAANATAGVAGVLYSAGNFAASRQVQNADTLNVTVTLSMA